MTNQERMIAQYKEWGYENNHDAILQEQHTIEYDLRHLRGEFTESEIQHYDDCLLALGFLEAPILERMRAA